MEMKISDKTLPDILNKFIIQVNRDAEPTMHDLISDSGFWLEKRINFLSAVDGKIIELGFYYSHRARKKERFIEYFNDPNDDGTRYHRLLTSKELKWLFKEFKKKNY